MPTRSRHVGTGAMATATANMPWPKAQTQFIHIVSVVGVTVAVAIIEHRLPSVSTPMLAEQLLQNSNNSKKTKVNIDNNIRNDQFAYNGGRFVNENIFFCIFWFCFGQITTTN